MTPPFPNQILKIQLQSLTDVNPDRMRITGLGPTPLHDLSDLVQLGLKEGATLSLTDAGAAPPPAVPRMRPAPPPPFPPTASQLSIVPCCSWWRCLETSGGLKARPPSPS